MPIRIIDNFTGRLTRNNIGALDSGMAKYTTTFGVDPFSNITSLTWLEAPVQIDPTGAVITDLIVCAKPNLESGITYVYAIGHTGRVYKIQVNQPSGFNPNLDNPVLLTTLTINSPTFKYGASIQFYNGFIYIGHDVGVTYIHTDGTGEAAIGIAGAGDWVQNVPRPSVIFNGVTYWGNSSNLTSIDTTNLIVSYNAISVNLPMGVQVRDLTVSPDGNYIQIIGSRVPAPDMTSPTQDTSSLSSGDSYRYLWNATPATAVTSYTTFNSYSINSNESFGNESYTMGYDLGGAAIYSGSTKIISLPNSISPNINAVFSTGNLFGFATPETASTFLQGSIMFYGQYDFETAKGLYRFLRLTAGSPQTDVIQMPLCLIVSNLFYGSSSAGYTNNQVGSAKLYFSTLETSSAPTTKYKFYKFTTVPTGVGTAIQGVYETQQETSFKLFRSIITQKFTIKEVRFYVQPLVTNNSFKIDLIGNDGNPISGGSETFTVGSGPITAGLDVVKYTPQIKPVYSVGVRITNLGSVNWIGEKMELEYEQAGR